MNDDDHTIPYHQFICIFMASPLSSRRLSSRGLATLSGGRLWHRVRDSSSSAAAHRQRHSMAALLRRRSVMADDLITIIIVINMAIFILLNRDEDKPIDNSAPYRHASMQQSFQDAEPMSPTMLLLYYLHYISGAREIGVR